MSDVTSTPSAAARRRRMPAYAFLAGAAVIGLLGLLAYLFWGGRAEAPTSPAEAVQTDAIDMPEPNAAAVRAQVDAALKAAPDPTNQPAAQAAREAEAQSRAAEATPAATPEPAAAPST